MDKINKELKELEEKAVSLIDEDNINDFLKMQKQLIMKNQEFREELLKKTSTQSIEKIVEDMTARAARGL